MRNIDLRDKLELEDKDYGDIGAKEFEDIVCSKLEKSGKIERQFVVPDRGDGRGGKIDVVWEFEGQLIPIEIDRKRPRQKSVFKVRSVNKENAFVIVRSPYQIIRV